MTALGGSTIRARGGVLHYAEAGQGPDLVWLPGGNDFAELVLHAQRGLLERYHLIAIDPRGQGRSHAPAAPELYAGPHHVADLLDALDALGLQRPLLGGHSRGSRTVLEFAARYPDRARAVVAVCVPALGGTRGRDARYRGNAAALREQGLEAFLRNARTAPRNPERRRAWEERLRTIGVEALGAQYEALARRPFLAEAMEEFVTPALIVTGERDHLREDCEALVAAVPGLDLVVVPGAAHAPMTENPDAYYAAVQPFLARWADRARTARWAAADGEG
ncbi:MAG TPA: alpha/beta fold hydrolase [Dehalococcoidia bacterium]|jgi:pimeloyl-ACP methyl ester carboxylesterase